MNIAFELPAPTAFALLVLVFTGAAACVDCLVSVARRAVRR